MSCDGGEAAADEEEDDDDNDDEGEGKRRDRTLSRKTSSHHELRWPLLRLPRPIMTQRSILPLLLSRDDKAGMTPSRKSLWIFW